MEFTTFYGIKIYDKRKPGEPIMRARDIMSEVTEHLSMNGYTFETNGENILFVFNEEIYYVLTILNDREIEYKAL